MNIICVMCRLNSTRLPEKALYPIAGQTAIGHLFDRLKQSGLPVVLCTGDYKDNLPIIDVAREKGIHYIAGSEKDVLSRFIQAIDRFDADNVIRVTGDDIITDVSIMKEQLHHHMMKGSDYTYAINAVKGMEVEVIASRAIKKAHKLAEDPDCSEYMSWYLDQPEHFNVWSFSAHPKYINNIRLTLDTYEDYALLVVVFDRLYKKNPYFNMEDVTKLFEEEPELLDINKNVRQKEIDEDINVRLKSE